jgi:phenylpropionate dioxygenase-like ring-hydroxylating dioxygenase large terminal subunit
MNIKKMNMKRFPFSSFPNGWFRVAYSQDLTPGKVMPLYYFGKNLVIFRTEDGIPCVLDAYCPHMGAHLGYGQVEGNMIRCPFHHWGFNQDGNCINVPYTDKFSPKAHIHSWPVCEVNGLIMVYHHSQGKAPTWKISEFSKWTANGWTSFKKHHWKVRTHVQEVAENSMDNAHFVYVHKLVYRALIDNYLEVNGPTLTRYIKSKLAWGGKLGLEEDCFQEFTYHGLGYGVIHSSLKSVVDVNTLVVILLTPIDEEYIDVHLLFSVKNLSFGLFTQLLHLKGMADCIESMEQEIPIFENKIFVKDPLLSEGEGAIMQYRHWVKQFYSDEAEQDKSTANCDGVTAGRIRTNVP